MHSSKSTRRNGRRSRPLLLERLEGRVVPSFLPPLAFAAGDFPVAVAAGDVNGDDLLDLAVANVNTAQVNVLLGNGDGSFQNTRTFEAGVTPLSVAVGDVNGDGLLDLAAANLGGVSVLLGNGDGTFGPARTLGAGNRPRSVALGDVNGDGPLDLAVANQSSANVSVLLGNGDGSFQAARHFAAGSEPWWVVLGDVNGDDLPDLAVANLTVDTIGTVSVLLGNGDGSFQAQRTFAAGINPVSVAVGDVNGDGRLDLAVTNYRINNLSVLLGTGDGSFQAARNFAAGGGPGSVAVGDVNSDGRLDLAVPNNASNTVSVLLGTGDGTFQAAQNFAAGTNPNSLVLGDVNGDGWLDAVTANGGSHDVSVLLNAADDAAFFYLDAPAQVAAGQPFDLTVFALSDTGLLAHGYRGTVAFWSSDKAATLPEPYSFQPEDGGIASFTGGVTLRTPGLQELYAFDLETFTVIGYAVVEVFPGGSPGGSSAGEGIGGGASTLGSFDFDVLTRIFRNHASASHDDLFDLFG